MPRRRVTLSPEEKALAAEIRAEQKRIDAEAKARRKGAAIKERLDGGISGPGAGLLRAQVGRQSVDAAVERFGVDIVARAAKALDAARKDTAKRRAKALEKTRAALKAGGLSDDDISRHRTKLVSRVRVPLVRIVPVRKGAYKYQRERKSGRRWVVEARYKTKAGARSGRIAYERLKARAKIAETLQISLKDAKALVRDVEGRAAKDLAKFMKSKAFKARSARWKKAITAKRWKAASVAALYELMEVDYSS